MWKPNKYQWIIIWTTFAVVSMFWMSGTVEQGVVAEQTKVLARIIVIAGCLLTWMFHFKGVK